MIEDVFDRLFQPFEPQEVHWKVGAFDAARGLGLAFAYVDARDVMDRLDVVVGPQGWQCRYSHADEKTVCELGLRVAGEWLWKADGAGDTELEAEKGALSDAFKRAESYVKEYRAQVRWWFFGFFLFPLSRRVRRSSPVLERKRGKSSRKSDTRASESFSGERQWQKKKKPSSGKNNDGGGG